MMGWHLLQILLILFVLQKIHASKGSSLVHRVKMNPIILHVSLDSAVSPLRQEVKKVSSTKHSPLSPDPQSPVPHEVKAPSDITHAPLVAPVVYPVPLEVKPPSGAPPAPFILHSQPAGSSPSTSPPPHESKDRSSIRHAPLASHNHFSGFSPAISPGAQEVKEPSNITHAPLALHLPLPRSSPAISPVSQEVNGPSNYTHPPWASHHSPSPVTSPAQHEAETQNVPHAPLPSQLDSSKTSPAMSPVQHEGRNVSNSTLVPLASPVHSPSSLPVVPTPRSPESSPVASPGQHEAETQNVPHAPFPSHPYSSKTSPAMSPVQHEGRNVSNSTLVPLASPIHSPSSQPVVQTPHSSESSPVASHAPHEVQIPNATHAPEVSHTLPLGSPPAISPPLHEVNNPSNGAHAPLASHPLPSGSIIQRPSSAPVASIRQHSGRIRIRKQAPTASHPHPSESSPKISPMQHKVNNPYNNAHAPLASNSPPLGRIIQSPSSAPPVPIPRHDTRLRIRKHAPAASHPVNPSNNAHVPLALHPTPVRIHNPSSAPIISTPHHIARIRTGNPASAPLSVVSPPLYHPGRVISPTPPSTAIPNTKTSHLASPPYIQGPLSPDHFPSHPPEVLPENRRRNAPSPTNQVPTLSPIHPPFPSTDREVAHPSSSSSVLPSPLYNWPSLSPALSPSESSSKKQRAPFPSPLWAFPPPPPNLGCKSLTCSDPLTYPPPGSSCVCVLPIKVGLRLRIALYTFFPLVSEFAKEIASGISMKQSQVRIIGANADSEDPEKTIVLLYLVPLGRPFDINTALLVYQRFFSKQVLISASYFGDYDVLYVTYPGLPPSPPVAPGNYDGKGGAFSNGNAGNIRPLGVDVTKKKGRLNVSLITIVVLSSVIALVLSIGVAWLLLLKCRSHTSLPAPTSQIMVPPLAKLPGTGSLISKPSSVSDSLSSSIAAYTGSAKTFTLAEMERATDRFHDSRIIGEGGFGRVYNGTLNDGTMVAIKVLKRDDRQGGREFLAEVEMLSRLHHRNLVKLIGICTEENARCLVYELIPNGSVESHLHGVNKESAPLDWNTRTKLALGAARGLAYLHEDSSPRVIHRDFKSSNILLEHDFTPKVSDFGLARTALDEGHQHISTQVMGTFGYVAPEYAMTGHLLVKSDVYSYGVVLLELLTGRKPVDMSQPPGQENLVAWARPLLTNIDDLQAIIDPALGTDIPYDSIAKVAAIASLCVQPEVSHRPFMGEVVQALKLVCNESDEHKLESGSECESSTRDLDIRIDTGLGLAEERMPLESDIFCTSARFTTDASGSFRRYSSSGPVATGRSAMLWQRAKGLSSGSMNDAVAAQRYGAGYEDSEHWP